VPRTVAALTATEAAPVDDRVSVCVAGAFRFTLPKLMAVALVPRAGADPLSARAKVADALPALAVRVTVVAVLTAVTVAVKPALIAPDATVTDAGTLIAELLLARLTASPPLAAAGFTVTEQLSVPAPVIEPLVQLSPVSTGTPVPPRLITVDAPVDELLASVNDPEAAPAAVGSNCTVSVVV